MKLFANGLIHTLEAGAAPEAVLVGDDGRVRALGSLAQTEAAARGARLTRIDLEGRTLLPGFNDAHVHIWKLGLLLAFQVDARRDAAPDIAAVIRAFQARAHSLPAGTWITGRGYNEADLPERRHLTRHDLDAASDRHPLALTRTCGHMIVANSLALALSGITADTPNPPGGLIVRDEHGQPTGLLQETAMGLLRLPDPTPEQLEIAILTAQRHQLSLGITSATDPLLTPLHVRVYRALEAGQKLLLRTNGMPIRRPDGGSETLPLPEKYVSDWLRLDTVKFFADGGLSGATAAVSQPYKITGSRGVLRFDTAELAALMQEAHDAGFRIGTHAIGDTAIEQVLGVYEGLYARAPNAAPRHRIEHLGLPTADHLRRCAALRLIAVPQTVFLPALGAAFRRYLPDANLARCYPVRAMLEAGLTVALSSDAPVVPDDNPLLGIKAALDRRGPDGQPIAPDQAISAAEAVRAYTLGGALASGDAANRGSIRAGKWADWVELDGDPLAAPPEALLSIRVARTWIAGEAVYTA